MKMVILSTSTNNTVTPTPESQITPQSQPEPEDTKDFVQTPETGSESSDSGICWSGNTSSRNGILYLKTTQMLKSISSRLGQ